MVGLLIIGVVLAVSSLATLRLRRGWRLRVESNPLWVVLALYLLSGFSAIVVDQDILTNFRIEAHHGKYYGVYAVCVFASLLPVLFLRGYSLSVEKLPSGPIFTRMLYLSAILIWYSVIYQMPYAVKGMALGAMQVRHDLNVERSFVLPDSFLTTVAVGVSSFYVVFFVLFFLALVRRMSLFIKASMFVGAASYLLSSLAFAGRDGVVFYVLTFIFSYGLFKSHMSSKTRRRIKLVGGVMMLAGVVVLAGITVQRFWGEQNYNDVIYGTVGYLGQQPYVFVETIHEQTKFYGLHDRFPVLAGLVVGKLEDPDKVYAYEWSFGTFLKDYYAVSGWSSLIVLVTAGSLLFSSLFMKVYVLPPFTALLVISLYFQLISSGVFYFRLGTRGGNLYLMIYFVLLLVCWVYERSSRRRRVFLRPVATHEGSATHSAVS